MMITFRIPSYFHLRYDDSKHGLWRHHGIYLDEFDGGNMEEMTISSNVYRRFAMEDIYVTSSLKTHEFSWFVQFQFRFTGGTRMRVGYLGVIF